LVRKMGFESGCAGVSGKIRGEKTKKARNASQA
jgi:hypothetical protein